MTKALAAWAVLAALALSACGSLGPVSPSEYVRAVESPESGLRVEEKVGELRYSAFYTPAEYLLIRDMEGSAAGAPPLSRLEEESPYQRMTFRIHLAGGQGEPLRHGLRSAEEYAQRLHYCIGLMQEDLRLLEGDRSYPCELFHFERAYHLSSALTFVLGFRRSEAEAEASRQGRPYREHGDKTLVFDDHLFGNGPVHLRIKAENLNELPEINWKSS